MSPEELAKLSPADRAAIGMIDKGGAPLGGAPTGGTISKPNFWERMAVGAGDLGKKLSPGIGAGIYDLMPHSNTEAAVTAASMLLPEAKPIGAGLERLGITGAERAGAAIGARGVMPGLARLGATAGVGAGTAALTGEESPGEGALQGAASSALAAIPAKAVDMVNRWHMSSRLLKTDPEAVGKIVNRMIPEFPRLNTAEDFRNAFVSNGAQVAASTQFEDGIRALNSLPGMFGRKLHVPEFANTVSDLLGKPVPVDLTMRQVGDLWPKAMSVSGYGQAGDPLRSMAGARVRASHEALADEIRAAIGKHNNKAPAAFDEVMRRYSRARRMGDVLGTPGVVKNGELNMPKLQSLYSTGKSVKRLEGGRQPAFDPGEVKSFWDSIFRGGKRGRADVPAVPMGFRVGIHGGRTPGIYPHFGHPGVYAGDPRTALAAILQNVGRGAGAGTVNYATRPGGTP